MVLIKQKDSTPQGHSAPLPVANETIKISNVDKTGVLVVNYHY